MFAGIQAEYAKVAEAHARAERDKERLPLEKGAREPPETRLERLQARQAKLYRYSHLPLLDVASLIPYIDWTPFFQTWELKGRFPAILEDEAQGAAARQLYEDAQAMLQKIVSERWFKPQSRHRLLARQCCGR